MNDTIKPSYWNSEETNEQRARHSEDGGEMNLFENKHFAIDFQWCFLGIFYGWHIGAESNIKNGYCRHYLMFTLFIFPIFIVED